MPDILTHTLFAEMVKDKIDSSKLKDLISEYMQLFQLAAQGPDFLFYYKAIRYHRQPINQFGSDMHKNDTAAFFIDAFSLLKETKDEQLLVYMMGFLCHFYLDKFVHPYVYYIAEKGIWDYKGNPHKISHYELEVTIDIRFWERYKKQKAINIDASTLVKVENLPDSVMEYFISYSKKYSKLTIKKSDLQKACHSMTKILHILYDPTHKKKLLYKLPLPRKPYREEPYNDFDILNSNHLTWHYLNENENRTDSVFDLIETAVNECTKVVNEVMEYIYNEKEVDLIKLIPDVTYNTNRPK